MLDKITVLACATDYNERLVNFQSSFKKYSGWDVRLLGMGTTWKSFRTKMECYHSALQKIDRNQIVVCLDAYDVFCVRDSQNFIQKFLAYQSPIVIGYETNTCFTIYNKYIKLGVCPSINTWKKFHNIQDNIHVNSGCIIGYAIEILKMFEWILNYKDFVVYDDQIGVGFYMNNFPHKVKIDIHDKFIINDTFGTQRQVSLVNGSITIDNDPALKPFFLHFPGLFWNHRKKYKNNYYLVAYYMNNDDTYFKETTFMDYVRIKWICMVVLLFIFICFYLRNTLSFLFRKMILKYNRNKRN